MGGTCGMYICKKCAIVNAIFGIILLVAGIGLWKSAPMWFNGWTILGVYLAVWGLFSLGEKEH